VGRAGAAASSCRRRRSHRQYFFYLHPHQPLVPSLALSLPRQTWWKRRGWWFLAHLRLHLRRDLSAGRAGQVRAFPGGCF